jgi:hypothetical protein
VRFAFGFGRLLGVRLNSSEEEPQEMVMLKSDHWE